MILIVNLGATTLGLAFEYTRGDNHQPHATKCRLFGIREGGEPILLAKGKADCSPLDNFNKSKGRKLALTRALKKLTTLTKLERQAVWEAYLNRRNTDVVAQAVEAEPVNEVVGTGTVNATT